MEGVHPNAAAGAPRTSCTAEPGCREYVAAYFRVQWGIQVNREKAQRRQAGRQHD